MTMENHPKTGNIIRITKRLVLLVTITLILFFIMLLITYHRYTDGSDTAAGGISLPWLSLSCFACGFIGGFVSIQQRIRGISNEELSLLASSWIQLTLVPLFGGIFALVLYALFLSQIISGSLFPVFVPPGKPSETLSVSFIDFVSNTFPRNPAEYGKLFFWCFFAGFSERFVPQLMNDVATNAKTADRKKGKG